MNIRSSQMTTTFGTMIFICVKWRRRRRCNFVVIDRKIVLIGQR